MTVDAPMRDSLADFLQQYDARVQALGAKSAQVIRHELPGIQETVDPASRIIAYGYGPRYADTICTLIPSKKGLKVGFYKGSELADPEGLLSGTGKVHRHVEVGSEAIPESPPFVALLHQAYEHYQRRRA
jgi:hypothetical protein